MCGRFVLLTGLRVITESFNAQDAYQELLDGFHEAYQDILTPEQYNAAKDDPDYFLVLIQLAYYDQEFEKVDKQGDQSLPYMNWKLFTQI